MYMTVCHLVLNVISVRCFHWLNFIEVLSFSWHIGGHVIGEIGRLSLHKSQAGHQAGAYPGFCSMRQLHCTSISTFPLDGMQVYHSFTASIKFAGINLYTWAERGPVRVKCLAKNTTQCPQPSLTKMPLA